MTAPAVLARFTMAGAALMLAHQVAGKAARDGLFLSQFEPTDLPKIVAAAAVMALLSGYVFSRVMERSGPARLIPPAFAASALLQVAEFAAWDWWPRATAVAVYLHIVGIGAVLLSGFWSLVSELFDPREARRWFGRIAGAGTAGGIAGGVLAERVSSMSSGPAVLLLLAALHLACAAILSRLEPAAGDVRPHAPAPPRSAGEIFRESPFLWNLAALVLFGTISAALIDYLFKSNAAASIGRGPELVRFFAIFYTGTQLLTFLVQNLFSRRSLDHLGPARTVASLPITVGASCLSALVFPSFPAFAGLRSIELILRGSLFRSGYELFYTPVPPSDKRAVKTIVDVGCDRLGDAAGAGFIQILLAAAPASAQTALLIAAAALSAACAWIAFRLERAYVTALEHGLANRAAELDLADVQDPSALSAVLQSMPRLPRSVMAARPASAPPPAGDAELETLATLRSGDRGQVSAALASISVADPVLVPQLIRLLAWDDVSAAARSTLVRCGAAITGQLTDTLLNKDDDFSIRRRIPRILAHFPTQRSVDGLLAGLADTRFEVRFHCGRALDQLIHTHPDLVCAPAHIYSAIDRELSAGTAVWESYRLLDSRDSTEGFVYLDEMLLNRANHILEHVFSLLAVVLPRESVKVAFRALHTDDRILRGLALEYLDTATPDALRGKLTALAEAVPAPGDAAAAHVAQALRADDSMALIIRPGLPPRPVSN